MSKKKPVKANTSVTKPQYFKAIDLLLAAVEYTRKGMPNRAAKALAEAAQDQQIDDAMNQLNDQQQDLQDQNFDQDPQGVDFDQQQQQTSRALARLIKASQQQVAEDQSDEDDPDEDGDAEEDDDGDGDGKETADADSDDADDLSFGLDDEDQDSQDGEMAIQASVQARLSRAARNKTRRT